MLKSAHHLVVAAMLLPGGLSSAWAGSTTSFGPGDTAGRPTSASERGFVVDEAGEIVISGMMSAEPLVTPPSISGGSALDGFNPGANGDVYALVVQPDGKILVGGGFTTLGGGGTGTAGRNRIGRLNADGSLDTSFNPGANGLVWSVAVQSDGKILVGGAFTTLGGGGTGTTTRNRIGRLNSDGSVDTSFNPGANSIVASLVVQPDGKILVGGAFTTLGGGGTGTTTRNRIGRLNADGSLDVNFNPGANGGVEAVAVQSDGRILVVGGFTMLGGGGTGSATRNCIGRLNADGALDTSFNPGANLFVTFVAVQPDGKILVAGALTMLGGGGTGTTPFNRIGRLNADGSLDTSFNPGTIPGNDVQAMALQPDGRILGYGSPFGGKLGRLNRDGSLDSSFNPGASNPVIALAVQPDGKILVGGAFTTLGGGGTGTTARNHIGRLNADGSLEVDFNPGANNQVFSVAVQADGKILVGGGFTTLGGGGTGTTTRNRIGRLNADGSLDPSFNPGANGTVYGLAVQTDGKILIAGNFTTLGGGGTGTTMRNRIGRLNADGSLDPSFTPGANGPVQAVAVQADGKILVGGGFTTLSGGIGTTTRNRIGRLNVDGSLDTSFDPGANSSVFAVAVQADGKILVGGGFTTLGGGGTGTTTRVFLGRLIADGSLDTGFNPGANNAVDAVVVQADGKVVVGGFFTTLGGGGTGTTTRNRIGRLNADGSLDLSFNPGANDAVSAVAVQADGKILVGGYFTSLGGGGTGTTSRNYLGRLNAAGALDTNFDPGANGTVYGFAVQADGKILVGGVFTTLGGGGAGTTTRNYLGRLTNTDAAIQNLSVTGSGSTVTWSRAGAAPEVWRATFESSTNGVAYTLLGSGTRVPGGWQLTGQNLPTNQNQYIRARGYYASGFLDGSASIVESILNAYVSVIAPTITTQPQHHTIAHFQTATLSVVATGTGLTYQWYVGSSGNTASPISGATASSYTTPALTSTTSYWVRVSNGSGSADSAAATLTVRGAPGDFNGDGSGDIAVYRPSTGHWFIRNQGGVQFGDPSDLPVPGDYNGDGVEDLAVFRPSTGQWFVRSQFTVQWGNRGDVPVPGDFNGDGLMDVAVYRPSTGDWFVRNQFSVNFGGAGGYVPVVGDYNGDGTDDVAVFQRSTGMWLVRNQLTAQFGAAGDRPVPGDYNGDGVTDIAIYRPSTGQWLVRNLFTVQFGDPGDVPVPRDYDGNGAMDVAIYRPSTGQWFVKDQFVVQFGDSRDVPVPLTAGIPLAIAGDYDGDGATDIAVHRPSTNQWFVRNQLAVQFGDAGDVPVPADYNGDRRMDVAVYRPSTGHWFVRNQPTVQWGDPSDKPVPGDYNGDGQMDVAVYRPLTGTWFVRNQFSVQFGDATDIPVPGDYNGDGVADLAVYRPSSGQWFVRNQLAVSFGDAGDIPVPADYNGDGKMDIAVYRPSTGQWFVRNQFSVMFGDSSDVPVPGDYNGNGLTDIAVYRPSTGQWFVRNLFTVQFGGATDVPIVRIGGPAGGTGDVMGRWFQPYTAVTCVLNPGDCEGIGSNARFAMFLELQQSGTQVTGYYFLKYDDVRAPSTRKEAYGSVSGQVSVSSVVLTLSPEIISSYGTTEVFFPER